MIILINEIAHKRTALRESPVSSMIILSNEIANAGMASSDWKKYQFRSWLL